ncbi:MAG: ribonuclease P protein component [Flavobacteriales bacterium]|nr:Ribonuclease P protein component [Flavobacteriales bacterium]MCC6578182.1 ribonuclease P protein component [Flavobacteriales bacterium]NUQ14684.1 ribonuclease P protein component [Flavobacteriales bacterium]
MERHTFPKQERLCGRPRIQRLMDQGRSVHVPPFRLTGLFMELDQPVPAQVAFAVPKRNLPRAVDRNRARRRMREAYRLHKHSYHPLLRDLGRQCAWLFVLQGRTVPGFQEVESKMIRALDRWFKEHA